MSATSFIETYEIISTTQDFIGCFTKGTQKTCKFCHRSSEEVSFNNVPHVLPELFGRNNFTSNEECDECNAHFGLYENDLSNFIGPYHSLLSQKTKKKIPSFQSRKDGNSESTTIKNVNGKPTINFGRNLNDFQYDNENKLLNIKFKKKRFCPINVFKGLVHVGLSLCPINELENFKDTIDWIMGRKSDAARSLDIPLLLIRTRFSNKRYSKPFATLYRRKEISKKEVYLPRLCLVVNSGILVFQIFLPGCRETRNLETKKFNLNLHIYPAFVFDLKLPPNYKEVTLDLNKLPIQQYDMNCVEKVIEDEMLTVKYSELIRT